MKKVNTTTFCLKNLYFGRNRSCTTPRAYRTTTAMKAKNPKAAKVVHTAERAVPPLPTETAKAKINQPITSLIAAALRAKVPTRLVNNFSSVRILAKTGKAVILTDTEKKSKKAAKEPFSPWLSLCNTNENKIPNTKGVAILEILIIAPDLSLLRISFGSSSMPMMNMKKIIPICAITLMIGISVRGNSHAEKLGILPSAVGPKIIPDMSSATTLGCFKYFFIKKLKTLERTIIVITSSKNNESSSCSPISPIFVS
mmetsp:Transcript_11315/g.15672  ORF Transcript_11315/g.15672 Transcript_11315/m.15672 type:complete len:256 (+) Transcript_11315:1835-2602(+)